MRVKVSDVTVVSKAKGTFVVHSSCGWEEHHVTLLPVPILTRYSFSLKNFTDAFL